jgi:hypothetical protein
MKRKILLIAGAILLLLHIAIPYYKAAGFIAGLKSSDPKRINASLPSDVSFREYPQIPGWYAYYSGDQILMGPFPLQNYRNDTTLSLRIERPSLTEWMLGQRSIRVFGTNYSKRFTVSYFNVSYMQNVDPQGQAD